MLADLVIFKFIFADTDILLMEDTRNHLGEHCFFNLEVAKRAKEGSYPETPPPTHTHTVLAELRFP